MSSLKEKSKNYYLYFNIPLHFLCIGSLFYINNWVFVFFSFILFYITIYWLGIQAGYHKLFAHRSWTTKNNLTKNIISIIGCYGLMGGPITWSQIHRFHHSASDEEKDPHTPAKGKFHAYFMWLFKIPNLNLIIVKDLLKDKFLIKVNNNSKSIVLITMCLFYLINIDLFLGFLLACIATFHSEMAINAFFHKKIDNTWSAVNMPNLSFISGGSTLHKNHHENVKLSNLAINDFEFDGSYLFIKILKK
jgi:fatty-acid desaturase